MKHLFRRFLFILAWVIILSGISIPITLYAEALNPPTPNNTTDSSSKNKELDDSTFTFKDISSTYLVGGSICVGLGATEIVSNIGLTLWAKNTYEKYLDSVNSETSTSLIDAGDIIWSTASSIGLLVTPGIGMLIKRQKLKDAFENHENLTGYKFPFLLFGALSLTIKGGLSLVGTLISIGLYNLALSTVNAEVSDISDSDPDVENLLDKLHKAMYISTSVSGILSLGYLISGIILLKKRTLFKNKLYQKYHASLDVLPTTNGIIGHLTIRF